VKERKGSKTTDNKTKDESAQEGDVNSEHEPQADDDVSDIESDHQGDDDHPENDEQLELMSVHDS
jgi:hypothetical protein